MTGSKIYLSSTCLGFEKEVEMRMRTEDKHNILTTIVRCCYGQTLKLNKHWSDQNKFIANRYGPSYVRCYVL